MLTKGVGCYSSDINRLYRINLVGKLSGGQEHVAVCWSPALRLFLMVSVVRCEHSPKSTQGWPSVVRIGCRGMGAV